MPAYQFEALDAEGRTQRGTLEADTARSARSALRAKALIPMVVQALETGAQAQTSGTSGWFAKRAFDRTGLAVWTRQLAGLVASGLPLERALTALLDEAETPEQRALLANLRAEVNAGSPFARALGQYPREFDEIYRSVVAAGEASGELALVLTRLADDTEAALALRAQVMGAITYPAVVTAVSLAIVVFLVTYVVPQVAGVFASGKKALPLLTTIMLGIAAAVRSYGWLGLGLLVAAIWGLRTAWRSERFGPAMDAAWLNMPLMGRLVRSYNAARFASTLATLTSAGVPILRALQSAADTLGNRAMRADALDALVLVREGAPLASALERKKRFPGLIAMFMRLGEQTGALPEMLSRAANQLSGEVARRSVQMASVLQPLLIVVMGGVVMLIVLAVLLPIIQLNTYVR